MNSSNIDTTYSQNIQNLTPDERQLLVKFTYSFDKDQLLPITQTTLLKIEPCFNVITIEDEVAKNFYENKSQVISKKHDKNEFIKQRTSSESDSFENENSSEFIKEKETTHNIIDGKHVIHDQLKSSSSIKSILKKSQINKEISVPKIDQLSISRYSSLSSSKNKPTTSTRLDFNQVRYLAEQTAKQYSSLHSIHSRSHSRSLFDQTINIFDPNCSYDIASNSCRPFRVQYYMKPYREQTNTSTNMMKQKSISLSPNRLAQQSDKTDHSHYFSNEYIRPSKRQLNRKQHISESPLREYTDQGRDYNIITTNKRQISIFISTFICFSFRKKKSSIKANSPSLSTRPFLSLIKSCQRNIPSIISTSVRQRISRSSQFPSSSSSSSSSSLSTDSYNTPSAIECSLTSINPLSQQRDCKRENETILKSHLPDTIYEHKKEHDEKIQRYDRLLEKMRATDEQLQSLSRLCICNTLSQRTHVKMNRESNLSLNKITSKRHYFSPIILQMCFIILIIFNLFVVYFFNEINVWWSEYVGPAIIIEQHDEDTLNF
ncbi:unnamed protein product [Rotaria sp. Silwood2]|nr:unnamed protein product [Rotaria sp. Silwood2]CAF4478903.1 unnamed protein product [Rotaria sp. Silwood2]